MRSLGSLFGMKEAGDDRRVDCSKRLEFDFDSNSLCGVTLGRRFGALRRLGPAENKRWARRGLYIYYSRGLEIGTSGGRISSYLILWPTSENSEHKPFEGAFRHRGEAIPLSTETTESEIIEWFGEPYWRSESCEGIILFYEIGNVERQFDLTSDGRLQAINVMTPPLLADEDQREEYRVTKAWPP